jgi:hypothetical protein
MQFGQDVPHERSVAKLLSPAFETSWPKHSTGEGIDEIEGFAWFSDTVSDELTKLGSAAGASYQPVRTHIMQQQNPWNCVRSARLSEGLLKFFRLGFVAR